MLLSMSSGLSWVGIHFLHVHGRSFGVLGLGCEDALLQQVLLCCILTVFLRYVIILEFKIAHVLL